MDVKTAIQNGDTDALRRSIGCRRSNSRTWNTAIREGAVESGDARGVASLVIRFK